MNSNPRVRIGTRKSKLAGWQANYAKWLLEEANPDYRFEIVELETEADIQKDKPLAAMGGKGAFVKELENALLDKRIDVAVHSVKDMTAILHDSLLLTAVLERGDPRDVLVGKENISLASLKKGMKIGTSSLRRAAQLRSVNPEIEIVPIRGNIDTRIQKVDQGLCDGIIVAAAAILRLSLENRITQYLDVRTMLPAPAQGAIGLECRGDDASIIAITGKVNHNPSMSCIVAERTFLRSLGANCHVPIACLATIVSQDSPVIQMQGMIASLDGRNILFERAVLPISQAEGLGQYLAQRLLAQGGKDILDSITASTAAGDSE